MSETRNDQHAEHGTVTPDRRKFLVASAGVAAASLLTGIPALAQSQARQPERTNSAQPEVRPGRRKLGSLEVSSIGLGVQNMSRTYQTTIPTRSEMLNGKSSDERREGWGSVGPVKS
jgi:hypothetical protein